MDNRLTGSIERGTFMNEALRQKLCEIVTTHGAAVADDPSRCGDLLRQAAPEDGDGVEALLCALKAHIPARLALLTEPLALAPLTAGLVRRLMDEQGLSEEFARWAVESWAIALGKGGEAVFSSSQASAYQHLLAPPRRSRWRWLRYALPVLLVVGSFGGWWWAAQRSEERRIGGRTGGVYHMAVSPDGRTILGVCGDKMLRVWDVESGRELRSFEGFQGTIRSYIFSLSDAPNVAIAPDGRLALSCGGCASANKLPYTDTDVRLWDLTTGEKLKSFPDPKFPVYHVPFAPDGRLLPESLIFPTGVPVYSVAFSPDGRMALAGMGGWKTLTDDPEYVKKHPEIKGDPAELYFFNPDGTPNTKECVLRLYDVKSGREKQRFEGHKREVLRAAFSPNGKYIVSAALDGTLRLWDVASGKVVRQVTLPPKTVITCMAVSPDGRWLLTGDNQSALALWNLETLEMEREEKHTGQSVRGVAFSPDGRRALSGGDDYILRLWNLPDLTEVRHFPGHTKSITDVAFLPDGRSGVSSSEDGTIRIWRLPP
jgi:WD40 repeat protein